MHLIIVLCELTYLLITFGLFKAHTADFILQLFLKFLSSGCFESLQSQTIVVLSLLKVSIFISFEFHLKLLDHFDVLL